MTRQASLVALLAVIAFVVTYGGQEPSSRSIPWQKGRDVTRSISPNDSEVTIVRRDSPPLVVDPPAGKSLAEWKTENAQVVLVGTVTGRVAEWTKARDWINSSVALRVSEVIKNTSPNAFSPGATVTLNEPIGELAVGMTRIRSDNGLRLAPINVGSEYLIFGGIGPGNEFIAGPTSIYEVTAQGIRRQAPTEAPNEFDFLSPTNLLSLIRSAAKR